MFVLFLFFLCMMSHRRHSFHHYKCVVMIFKMCFFFWLCDIGGDLCHILIWSQFVYQFYGLFMHACVHASACLKWSLKIEIVYLLKMNWCHLIYNRSRSVGFFHGGDNIKMPSCFVHESSTHKAIQPQIYNMYQSVYTKTCTHIRTNNFCVV